VRATALLFALALSAFAACGSAAGPTSPVAPQAAPRRADDPPPLPREFRGAWVATVDNIDWPSRPGLPTADARAELDALVARAAALQLNALVFQVRPAGDALYPSQLEPWSEFLTGSQGKPPQPAWDPLAHVIERCHAAGIELHAWFNPYRASHPGGTSAPAANHVRRKMPSACVRYGEYDWMDPGEPRCAEWTLLVIRDVVQRYDVDGVHLDDYFYPYPQARLPFPDERSWSRYRQGGGKLARDDWRRHNIDTFVERLYRAVHDEKPWVQVGISPFGIARPGVPAGIQAGVDQYGGLYADVVRWQQQGWLDYLAPQLYWPIDQKPQSFAVLLPWWHTQNPRGRHVWPGINPGRVLQQKPPTRADELADQIELIRGASRAPGHIHFSFKALRGEAPPVAGALRRLYRGPALAPASAWLRAAPAAVTQVRREAGADGGAVCWTANADTRFVAVQVRGASGWRLHTVTGAALGRAALPADANAVAVHPIARNGDVGTAVQPAPVPAGPAGPAKRSRPQ
jgi:uncharacterized lipoprotein YddW (UPF0748 family)